eukprot:7958173-Heterocapsa_arctica.AAC.1
MSLAVSSRRPCWASPSASQVPEQKPPWHHGTSDAPAASLPKQQAPRNVQLLPAPTASTDVSLGDC